MSDETNKSKKLSLSGSSKLSLGGTLDSSSLRGEGAGRRGKTVQVQVRRKRPVLPARPGAPAPRPAPPAAPRQNTPEPEASEAAHTLTAAERAKRMEVLKAGLNKSEAK